MKSILLLLLFFSPFIHADEKEYIVMHGREGTGLFSAFHDVLALIKYYDQGLYQGIEIDFGKGGQYYSPERGDNWWTYYCQPICFGEKINIHHTGGDAPGARPWEVEAHTSRDEAKRLIDKYIKFKPEIMEKINRFQMENFDGHYVIAVHYRGTDKWKEAPPVYSSDVGAKIDMIIRQYGGDDYKIFIATDQQSFLDYMIRRYGERIFYNTKAIRSRNDIPLHLGNYDRYQCGIDAIIDAVLLSRGQYLIRMSSNLSRWSTFFNPDLPVLELNQLYDGPKSL